MSENFDLLGDLIPEGFGKRGRPPHVPNDEKRLKVRVLLAFSGDEQQVADGLGISLPTLRKHYFRELRAKASARVQLKATLLYRLMAESEKGNATAIEKLFKRIDKMELAELAEQLRERGSNKAPQKGKKEIARDAANNVAAIYAPPAGPVKVN